MTITRKTLIARNAELEVRFTANVEPTNSRTKMRALIADTKRAHEELTARHHQLMHKFNLMEGEYVELKNDPKALRKLADLVEKEAQPA